MGTYDPYDPDPRGTMATAVLDIARLVQRPVTCLCCGCLCRPDEPCPGCRAEGHHHR